MIKTPEFKNDSDVGTLAEGALDEGTIYEYIVERRMKLQPYLGMKQPVPHGCSLGTECVVKLLVDGQPAHGMNYRLFCDGEEVSGGIFYNGESAGISISMPYAGIHDYSIEFMHGLKDKETSQEYENT
jgi:hypothetical protein